MTTSKLKEIETDILVVGGGSAGIAAAVAASKDKKVVLIDAHNFLGGNATISEVGTICGLYHQSKKKSSKYITDGFARTFAERIAKISDTSPIRNRYGMHYLPYDPDSFKQTSEDFLKENSVELMLNSKVIEVNKKNNLIDSVVIKGLEGHFLIKIKSVVDCSGISVISTLADLPLMPSEYYQSAAMVFTMSNINLTNEFSVNVLFAKLLRTLKGSDSLNRSVHSLHVVPGSFKNNQASFKIGIPLKVTLKNKNKQELYELGTSIVHELVEIIGKSIPAFREARLESVADNIGIRVENRPFGKYVLNESDVVNCKKFPKPAAVSAWPIEEWKDDLNVSITYLKENDWYEIPEETLISRDMENLFFGGKNISATERAIGSARVMGVCLQTGYAAGKLAAAVS